MFRSKALYIHLNFLWRYFEDMSTHTLTGCHRGIRSNGNMISHMTKTTCRLVENIMHILIRKDLPFPTV